MGGWEPSEDKIANPHRPLAYFFAKRRATAKAAHELPRLSPHQIQEDPALQEQRRV